jgi:hypothetical protein
MSTVNVNAPQHNGAAAQLSTPTTGAKLGSAQLIIHGNGADVKHAGERVVQHDGYAGVGTVKNVSSGRHKC